MKLLVNEAKLTGLWATELATIQQVLILKFALEPESQRAFRKTGLPERKSFICTIW